MNEAIRSQMIGPSRSILSILTVSSFSGSLWLRPLLAPETLLRGDVGDWIRDMLQAKHMLGPYLGGEASVHCTRTQRFALGQPELCIKKMEQMEKSCILSVHILSLALLILERDKHVCRALKTQLSPTMVWGDRSGGGYWMPEIGAEIIQMARSGFPLPGMCGLLCFI